MWSWKTTRPKSQVTLWVGAHLVSHHLVKFGGHWHGGSWDNGFSLSRDLARPSDQRIMWIYWEESIKVSYLSAKFGGHRSYENRDINSHINSYMNTYKKMNKQPRSTIWRDFQSLEYWFTILKCKARLPEKQKEEQTQLEKQEEEHRKLQSVMRFTRMQKIQLYFNFYKLLRIAIYKKCQNKTKWKSQN